MSHHAYRVSRELLRNDPPFSALIMAAMRKADSTNAIRLRTAFPEIAIEVQARYHAPSGVLAADGEAGVHILAQQLAPDAEDNDATDDALAAARRIIAAHAP